MTAENGQNVELLRDLEKAADRVEVAARHIRLLAGDAQQSPTGLGAAELTPALDSFVDAFAPLMRAWRAFAPPDGGERCARDERTDELYQAFRKWFEGEGLRGDPPSKVAFGKALRLIGSEPNRAEPTPAELLAAAAGGGR